MPDFKDQATVNVSVASERAEALSGVLIAAFAALMALSDLFGSNLEEDMMVAHNQHNSYFSWYQSKSIKQSLKESELATLESLKLGLGSLKFEPKMAEIKKEIAKYKLEKNEILLGSANIPKANWVQDLDGQMGKIIGVKEWEAKAAKLEKATNKFDISMMFFQISLVLGAVCVIIYDNPRLQKSFIALMLISGTIGIIYAIIGYISGQ